MDTDRILYIEAHTGISGDMLVAALLDLGAPEDRLKAVLKTLPIDGFQIAVSRKKRADIDICDFDVQLDHDHENHDHDMDYLYGHLQGHSPSDSSEKCHDHEHHHHHDHNHHHRTLSDVRDILARTEMTDGARAIAVRVFEILARAEAQAHGTTAEEVHFHEVGAVDSIVDIVAAAVCVDALAPARVVISPLTEGTGTVRTQHGILPVPVPAVAHIAENEHLILQSSLRQGEWVTPTGAAIAAAIRTERKLPPQYTIEKTGVGGGKRAYEPPSMLRAMWLREVSDSEASPTGDRICRLETDIDDCTGEELGRVMECCYAAGAREVHFAPIFMKKNRPAYELTVLADANRVSALEETIFRETTTIGIRRQWMERTILPRELVEVETEYGTLRAKRVTLPDGTERTYPEYESMRELADRNGIPIRDIFIKKY